MKKKIFKLVVMFLFTFNLMLLLTENVHAYIDPSVVNYAIQAIAGIVIAVGAIIGIYWRKAKKRISNKLGIDENKNKEVEKDEIIIKEKNKDKRE